MFNVFRSFMLIWNSIMETTGPSRFALYSTNILETISVILQSDNQPGQINGKLINILGGVGRYGTKFRY